jgi:hypothetical protein
LTTRPPTHLTPPLEAPRSQHQTHHAHDVNTTTADFDRHGLIAAAAEQRCAPTIAGRFQEDARAPNGARIEREDVVVIDHGSDTDARVRVSTAGSCAAVEHRRRHPDVDGCFPSADSVRPQLPHLGVNSAIINHKDHGCRARGRRRGGSTVPCQIPRAEIDGRAVATDSSGAKPEDSASVHLETLSRLCLAADKRCTARELPETQSYVCSEGWAAHGYITRLRPSTHSLRPFKQLRHIIATLSLQTPRSMRRRPN